MVKTFFSGLIMDTLPPHARCSQICVTFLTIRDFNFFKLTCAG